MLALANEPTRSIYSTDYHARRELPPDPTVQTALAALIKNELVGRNEAGE